MKEIGDGARRILAAARLLALDVDGTLTDGGIRYSGDPSTGPIESQRFCVRDGQGLAWLREAGVRVAWITGRGGFATEARARELGVDVLRVRAGPKDAELEDVQRALGVAPQETVAMGDDLPDLALGRRAALLCCPADAAEELRARAGLVTAARGGRGAVRELCEAMLRARGSFDGLLLRYGG